MTIPGLDKTKDLDLLTYTQIMFLERIEHFKRDVVDQSPSIKTSGICGDLDKLCKNALAVIEKLKKMKELV